MTMPVNNYPAASTPSLRQSESSAAGEPGRQVRQFPHTHLVVLQHGLWGSITDLENVDVALRTRFGSSARVIRSDVNERSKTMEGIAVGAQRLADFIQQEASLMPNLDRISFVGYSLGGVYGRIAITELYARGFFAEPSDAGDASAMTNMANDGGLSVDSGVSTGLALADVDTSLTEELDEHEEADGGSRREQGVAEDIDLSAYKHILKGTPKWTGRKIRGEHFVTMATPHLGVRKSQEFLLTKFWNWAAEKLTGETGQELLLLDGLVGREPLMVEIARGIFLDALKLFRTRSLYANALNDNTVPYFSAAVVLTDVYLLYTPYEVSEVKVMASNSSIACPEYSRALRSKATELVAHKHVDHTDQHYVACLKAMYKGLDSVEWDRYDVVLPGRHTHPHIIVRRGASTQGFKVLQHLADTLFPESSHTRQRLVDRTESAPSLVHAETTMLSTETIIPVSARVF